MPCNLELIETFYYQIWNEGDEDAARQILASDFAFRGSTGPEKVGIAPFLSYVRCIRGALSAYECVIHEVVSQGEATFCQMTFQGEHTGVFFGAAPTGKQISWSGAALFRFGDGKITSLWVLGDVDSLKVQLGLSERMAP